MAALTLPGMTVYNLLVPRFNLTLSVAFAIVSAALVYLFFWLVLRATSLPD